MNQLKTELLNLEKLILGQTDDDLKNTRIYICEQLLKNILSETENFNEGNVLLALNSIDWSSKGGCFDTTLEKPEEAIKAVVKAVFQHPRPYPVAVQQQYLQIQKLPNTSLKFADLPCANLDKLTLNNPQWNIFNMQNVTIGFEQTLKNERVTFESNNSLRLTNTLTAPEVNIPFIEIGNNIYINLKSLGSDPDGVLIGTGAYGRVLVGTDLKTGKPVAVKIQKHAQHRESQEILELKIGTKIKGLPNLCPTIDYGKYGNYIISVMPRIEGEDLFSFIVAYNNKQENIPVLIIKIIVEQVLTGLKAMHDCKILYHDLKSENIMIDKSLHATLFDFGLSQIGDKSDEIQGTPLCLTPEVFLGKGYTVKSDIFSVGVLISELFLTSYLRKQQTGFQAIGQIRTDKTSHNYDVQINAINQIKMISPEFAKIAKLCLSFNPDERPSIEVLLKEIRKMTYSHRQSRWFLRR